MDLSIGPIASAIAPHSARRNRTAAEHKVIDARQLQNAKAFEVDTIRPARATLVEALKGQAGFRGEMSSLLPCVIAAGAGSFLLGLCN